MTGMDELHQKLEQLKKVLKTYEFMDVIDQCKIVGEALGKGAPYMENVEGLALYLEVSKNHVYKMGRVHTDMVDEAKEYFRGSGFQVHTAFQVASMAPDEQRRWVAERRKVFLYKAL